ncbi:hypothetical protein SAMD00024442_28_41 [Candidatus Symbiothrix dinenymphae]|nr:hypothetical protein SAMD00024442_28_41 [Candidatus Symbiothrix dinenymphae]
MKRKIIFGVLIGLSLGAFAQGDYPFVDMSYNHIQVPDGDSSRLNRAFLRLNPRSLQREGLTILHIGGSHVQADIISHRVRQNFKERFAADEVSVFRGFVFPYTVAKTNNPSNYSVTYSGKWNAARNIQQPKNREVPLGVGGVAVYTNDSAAQINVVLNPPYFHRQVNWEFNILRLLGYSLDKSEKVQPVLSYQDNAIKGIPNLAGTCYQFFVPKSESEFSLKFVQEDSVPHTFVVDGFIISERNTNGLVYHSIGVNGASVPSYLSCENWESELRYLHPDLIIFGIGVNDAVSTNFTKERFIANYNTLIERIERVNPDCAYIFVTNNDSYRKVNGRYEVNKNGLLAREAFYELAKQHQGGLWDLFQLMGGLTSMRKWQDAGLAQPDKIHFKRDGYLYLGDLLYEALMNYNPTDNVKK